jgi:hypothetical protein
MYDGDGIGAVPTREGDDSEFLQDCLGLATMAGGRMQELWFSVHRKHWPEHLWLAAGSLVKTALLMGQQLSTSSEEKSRAMQSSHRPR